MDGVDQVHRIEVRTHQRAQPSVRELPNFGLVKLNQFCHGAIVAIACAPQQIRKFFGIITHRFETDGKCNLLFRFSHSIGAQLRGKIPVLEEEHLSLLSEVLVSATKSAFQVF
jgi:hypothetical protein